MNIIILKTSANFNDNKKFFNAIERLNHNFVGFVALGTIPEIVEIDGYNFYPIEYLQRLKYDLALFDCNLDDAQRFAPLLAHFNVPFHKVNTFNWLLKQLFSMKYGDIKDPVIQETLAYWQNHELDIWNQHMVGAETTMDEVHIDESCNLPYIIFKTVEGKERRMYYPRDGSSQVQGADGKKYVQNVLREQVPTSPHLYIKGTHKVDEGDVLIDAGVCEGNFALRYVDICSKVYLFEMDKKWFEPLYYSFKDCWDKVEFIPRAVAASTRGGADVALDDAVNVPVGSKIFLKMDIEGAEPEALRGAKKILSTNKVKASICSYHKADDMVNIKSIFQSHGYRTATSDGYMIFIYDSKLWETVDFRKGIVYATNC